MVMEIITFEQIYDIVRKEKTSDEIQEVDQHIIGQIANYLRAKQKILDDSVGKVISSELEKQKMQINSAKSMAKEFYERRERKLLMLALNKSKMQDLDTSKLLDLEKEIVEKISKIIEEHREAVLKEMFSTEETKIKTEGIDEERPADNIMNKEIENVPTEIKDDKAFTEFVTVKFLGEQHKFYGPNLEIYGPFKDGDIANLPKIISDILIHKEKAIVIGK